MSTELIITFVLSLALSQFFNANAHDITKYGAVPGQDISKALCAAWTDAIASPTPTVVVIPKGEWQLTQVILNGPNKAPLELQILGTLTAPSGALPDNEGNWISIMYADGLTINGGRTGILNGCGQQAWHADDCHKTLTCDQLPINMLLHGVNNSEIRDITSKDSKNFHITVQTSNNVTFLRVNISAPEDSHNTDGIHMGRVSNIKIQDTTIKTGDDCISIGDDSSDVHIDNVDCGPGHGISIGSLGRYGNERDVKGIHVKNCRLSGTSNGVRIKTWPASKVDIKACDIHFDNITMDNVSNPIIIDQEYCPWNKCDKSKPSMIQISDVSINNIRGTSGSCEAIIIACSSAKPCKNVTIGDVDLTYTGKLGPITTQCSNMKPILVGKQNPPLLCGGAAAGAAGPSGAHPVA